MREEMSPLAATICVDNAVLYTYIPDVSEALQALKDNDWQVRTAAAIALEEIGPRAAAAVPSLIQTLEKDPREDVRRASAEALGSIGPAAAEAVPALTRALSEGSAYVRWAVSKALDTITGRNVSGRVRN